MISRILIVLICFVKISTIFCGVTSERVVCAYHEFDCDSGTKCVALKNHCDGVFDCTVRNI